MRFLPLALPLAETHPGSVRAACDTRQTKPQLQP
jgi:hypothetical protein